MSACLSLSALRQNSSRCRQVLGGQHRRALGEFGMPACEPGPALAPRVGGEAEVEIRTAREAIAIWPMSGRLSKRSASLSRASACAGRRLETVGREVVFGFGLRRPVLLAEPQHVELHEAVAERLAAQRREPGSGIGGG